MKTSRPLIFLLDPRQPVPGASTDMSRKRGRDNLDCLFSQLEDERVCFNNMLQQRPRSVST